MLLFRMEFVPKHVLWRVWIPLLHETVQSVHPPHLDHEAATEKIVERNYILEDVHKLLPIIFHHMFNLYDIVLKIRGF